jgi:hypothetical protein
MIAGLSYEWWMLILIVMAVILIAMVWSYDHKE